MSFQTPRTEKKDAAFFKALQETGNVTTACSVAEYGRSSVYEWRKQDVDFGRRWQEADDVYVEAMELEADRRGMHGVRRPVLYQGKQVTIRDETTGEERPLWHVEHSDTLLIFRLKGKRPETYREHFEIAHDPNRPMTVVIREFGEPPKKEGA